jgi:CheY-like chemotaxis protein
MADSDGEGRGATFTVRLPIVPAVLNAAVAPEQGLASTAFDAHAARLRGLPILLVEDDPDARALVSHILREWGVVVTTASTGQEALEIFHNCRPKVLISDIGLPEMDGYELIQRVRAWASSEGGTIPAIALTAFAGLEDRTRALRAGYQAHVPKPIDSEELIAVLASFVDLIEPRLE